MRVFASLVVVAASMWAGGDAKAAEPSIVEACVRAAAIQLGVNTVLPDQVQAFPELSPPRVQFVAFGLPSEGAPGKSMFDSVKIAKGEKVENERGYRDMGDVRCEFSSALPPHKITKFQCSAFSCHVDDQRLEELQVLLAREGY